MISIMLGIIVFTFIIGLFLFKNNKDYSTIIVISLLIINLVVSNYKITIGN